jgi:hypothetical protein
MRFVVHFRQKTLPAVITCTQEFNITCPSACIVRLILTQLRIEAVDSTRKPGCPNANDEIILLNSASQIIIKIFPA